MIPLDSSAPQWAQVLARNIDKAIDANLVTFVRKLPYTVATVPSAASYPWKMIFLSDGAGSKFVAVSNGSAWYYLEGTAV